MTGVDSDRFQQEFALIVENWRPPLGRAGPSTWRVQQALLRIACGARSTVIAPGLRRIEDESLVSRKTALGALERLRLSEHIVRLGTPLAGKPQAYRLHPAGEKGDAGPEGKAAPDEHSPSLAPGHSPTPPVIQPAARLAFRGRDVAFRVFLELDVERASAPTALAARLGMTTSTIRSNLSWLSTVRSDGVPWAWREPLKGGGWFAGLEPTDDDFYSVAISRGKLESWGKAWIRIQTERASYDEAFRAKRGFDRKTGEILN